VLKEKQDLLAVIKDQRAKVMELQLKWKESEISNDRNLKEASDTLSSIKETSLQYKEQFDLLQSTVSQIEAELEKTAASRAYFRNLAEQLRTTNEELTTNAGLQLDKRDLMRESLLN